MKATNPLLVELEKLEWKYLTDPTATLADRAAYFAKAKECREARLIPVKS